MHTPQPSVRFFTKQLRADQQGLFKSVIIYGVGLTLSRGIYVFFLPFLTRYLSPVEYGFFELANTVAALGTGLALMGIQEAIFRFFFDYESLNHKQATVSSGILFGMMALCLAAILVFLFRKTLALFVLRDSTRTMLVILVGIKMLADGARRIGMNLFRMRNRPLAFGLLSFLFVLVGSGLAVSFLLLEKRSGEFVYLAMLSASALVGILTIVYNKDLLNRKALSIPLLRGMLVYGAPLAFATIFNWIIDISDRLVINVFVDTSAVGIYTAGYRLASPVLLVAMAAGMAWPFMALSNMGQKDAPQTFGRSFTMFLVLFLTAATTVLATRKWLVNILLGQTFRQAIAYIAPIVLGFVFMGLVFVVESGIAIKKKSWVAMTIRVVAGASNLGLNLALVPRFGAIAAAYTTLATYGLLFITSTIAGMRYFPIQFETDKLLVLLVTFGTALVLAIAPSGLIGRIAAILLCLASVAFVLFTKTRLKAFS